MAKRVTRKPRKKSSFAANVMGNMMDQLRALDEQRRSILSGAKSEAMKAAEAAVAALNSLGFNYRLTENAPARGRRKSGARKVSRAIKNRACPVCGFTTSPPHDARSHRGQAEKKPFTAAELSAKGMSKV